MKNCLIVMITILVLTAASCTRQKNPEKIKKEVSLLLENYVKEVNTGGLEKAAYFFEDDERFYWVEDGIIQYPDRTSLLNGIAEFSSQVKTIHLEISHQKIDVIDANHALLFVQYKEDIILQSDYTIVLDGAMTILAEKKNNIWKFLSGHSSVKKTRNNQS